MAEPERADDTTGTENGDTMGSDTAHTALGHTALGHTALGHTHTGHAHTGHTAIHPVSAPDPLHGDVITTDDITTDDTTTDDPAPAARRRGPDPLALIVGLATLAMAVFAFVGELPDLSGFDPRWLLAGGAVAVGLVLLVGSLRSRSGGRRGGS